MDSGLERPTTINTRTTFQSKNRAIKKEKRISRIKPKKTLKVPSRRLESRIEKRKVARLIGGPVFCKFRQICDLPKGTKSAVLIFTFIIYKNRCRDKNLSLCVVRPGSGRFGGGFLGGILGGIARAGFSHRGVLSRTPLIIRTVDQDSCRSSTFNFCFF